MQPPSVSPARAPLCALLLAAGLGACAHEPPPLNLILISIDTLRADRLGCYGYGRPTTPFLDRQAERGVLFRDASATSSWTYPSHASLFTGLYPGRNGATELKRRMHPEVPSLAEWLVARGYRAAGVVSSTLFQGYGLERGFERLEYVDPGGPEPSRVTERALAWLAEAGDAQPFFYLIHYLDPHSDYHSLPEYEQAFREPYEGPASGTSEQLFEHVRGYRTFDAADGRHLSNLYDAGVRQQDAELEKLFAELERSGLLARSVVILTSDHGEEFLEHGGVMHGLAQYEESVRVPLILWSPALGPGRGAGVRVDEPVSLIDVLPTALDLLGLPAPPDLDGVSLRALWEQPGAGHPARALFIEADMDPPGPTARTMVPGDDLALRRSGFKLVLDPQSDTARLYDLQEDPRELQDVAAQHPALAAELRAELERHRARQNPGAKQGELSAEDLEKLRGLGYAGEHAEPGRK